MYVSLGEDWHVGMLLTSLATCKTSAWLSCRSANTYGYGLGDRLKIFGIWVRFGPWTFGHEQRHDMFGDVARAQEQTGGGQRSDITVAMCHHVTH